MIRFGLLLIVVACPLGYGCGTSPSPVIETVAPEPPPPKTVFTRRKGTIQPAKVSNAMAAHLGAFKNCYGDQLSRSPNIAVELVLGFTIDADGTTRRGRVVRSTGMDQPMNHCVLDTLADVRFPAPEGGHVDVTFPLEFKPQ